ncbi:DUF3237 domain-containing protein [Microbacterium trichothecenolyticum]|uniref:DUF3237 domain-containing protein n=1 Tax=Microbacterium trichothecenolyticum TaxID=69370 RepID=UPI001C6E7209|nr:DUF3237 domain-containing protein [Microbacterium trichothecenolyticum]MBW9120025.1 DUF3237 domain-containing protein [Microbacterium trichothecenolyticum]
MTPAPQPQIPSLERAFEVVADLGPLEDHGMTRAGHRRIIPVIGGTVTGAFAGTILPGGADWQTVRADGSIEIDGRYSARGDDGSLLYIRAQGVRSGDPAVLEALLRGEDVDPSRYYFRAALTLECAARPEFERSLYLASYIREANRVRYVAYRVT